METKNNILARQKEMQLSLDKVKHLIRLIQTFSFSQALAETEAEDERIHAGAPDGLEADTVPKTCSVVTSGGSVPSGADATLKTDECKSAREQVVANEQGARQHGAPEEAGHGTGTGGGVHTGTADKVEADVALPAAGPAHSPVVTTNGSAEPTCTNAGSCTNSGGSDSDNKMAVITPPDAALDRKQEDVSNNGSSINSKTSEVSQDPSPALTSASDTEK